MIGGQDVESNFRVGAFLIALVVASLLTATGAVVAYSSYAQATAGDDFTQTMVAMSETATQDLMDAERGLTNANAARQNIRDLLTLDTYEYWADDLSEAEQGVANAEKRVSEASEFQVTQAALQLGASLSAADNWNTFQWTLIISGVLVVLAWLVVLALGINLGRARAFAELKNSIRDRSEAGLSS
jgi:hypothetical protein